MALAAKDGLRIRYLVDTHTHADHFSATQQLARQLAVPVVMHGASPAPFVDLRLQSGDAGALYESLFEGVLKLDPSLKVFPAHEYKGRSHSTIGQELAENPDACRSRGERAIHVPRGTQQLS